MSIEARIQEFAAINPAEQLKKFKAQGKKVVGVLPYYAPEELVYAAGMVPMGIWGSNNKEVMRSKEYCATFYCDIAQLALEMLLDGTMDQLVAEANELASDSDNVFEGMLKEDAASEAASTSEAASASSAA